MWIYDPDTQMSQNVNCQSPLYQSMNFLQIKYLFPRQKGERKELQLCRQSVTTTLLLILYCFVILITRSPAT